MFNDLECRIVRAFELVLALGDLKRRQNVSNPAACNTLQLEKEVKGRGSVLVVNIISIRAGYTGLDWAGLGWAPLDGKVKKNLGCANL